MRVAILGRTEILYETVLLLQQAGHEIAVIVTAKAAPEYVLDQSDFAKLAQELGVPFFIEPRLSRIHQDLAVLHADIAVSVNFPLVISQDTIDMFPLGILNAHGGDLPFYRGNACQAWAILNGEEEVGLCVHKMIGGELDNGDIITRDYLPINELTKVTEIWQWMMNRIPALFLDALNLLAAQPNFVLESQPKSTSPGSRCYPRRPEDGRITWNSSARHVLRLINASNRPYSGAFCEFEGVKVTVWDASLEDDGEMFYAVPGQITKIDSAGVVVACGEGKIRLRVVEIEGNIQTASEVVRSIRQRFS